jgi:hypothetical protein
VALSNMYPQAKSVGAWLKGGWHVALAYVIGFFVLYFVLGWHADAPVSKPVPATASSHSIAPSPHLRWTPA